MSQPKVPIRRNEGLDQGETIDVAEIHVAVIREKPEPKEGFEPLNLWIVAGIAGLLFWGGSYLTAYSGRFEADEFSELQHGRPVAVAAVAEDPLAKVKREGMVTFNGICAACHNEDGAGKAGVAPTLAGSDIVNAAGPNRLIRIVRHGLKGPVVVNASVTWNPSGDPSVVMGSQWDAIGASEAKLAAVLTYIRTSWGNTGSAVTPQEVSAVLAETKARSTDDNWTMEELSKIPVSGSGASAAAPSELTPEQLKEKLKALPADKLQELLKDVAK